MRRVTLLLIPLLLLFAAGNAALVRLQIPLHPSAPIRPAAVLVRPPRNPRAEFNAAGWDPWQSAMQPDGSSHPAIQFRWRSDPPCTLVGCHLAVQIRNTSSTPIAVRCLVYFDPPPVPYGSEVHPVTIDVLLESFSSSDAAPTEARDTTSPLIIPGIRIAGVVVESTKAL